MTRTGTCEACGRRTSVRDYVVDQNMECELCGKCAVALQREVDVEVMS